MKKAGPGRPSNKDANAVVSHLECIVPYILVHTLQLCPQCHKTGMGDAECPICLMLLNSPVELITRGGFQYCCSWLNNCRYTFMSLLL